MTAHVDDVFANAPVWIVDQRVRLSFGARVVGDTRRLSIDAAVRSHVVVVAHDVLQDRLELAEGVCRSLGEELLQRAMPSLDLPAGLGKDL